MRGPGVLPAVPGRPALRTRRRRFDDLVLGVVADLEQRWHSHLGLVEYVVEEVPPVPDGPLGLRDDEVPLAVSTRGRGGEPSRLVVYRQPVEHRADGPGDLAAIVLTVVVEQVAELLGVEPSQVDSRYRDEE